MRNLKLSNQEYCDILNGLNLLIEANDSAHYNDRPEWNRLCKLSDRICAALVWGAGNIVVKCDYCEGDHQYNTIDQVRIVEGYNRADDRVMCDACESSQESPTYSPEDAGSSYWIKADSVSGGHGF